MCPIVNIFSVEVKMPQAAACKKHLPIWAVEGIIDIEKVLPIDG